MCNSIHIEHNRKKGRVVNSWCLVVHCCFSQKSLMQLTIVRIRKWKDWVSVRFRQFYIFNDASYDRLNWACSSTCDLNDGSAMIEMLLRGISSEILLSERLERCWQSSEMTCICTWNRLEYSRRIVRNTNSCKPNVQMNTYALYVYSRNSTKNVMECESDLTAKNPLVNILHDIAQLDQIFWNNRMISPCSHDRNYSNK
jgi:hypothetical protein